MPVEFRLPDLGEGIHEGEVVDILVSVGDRVIDGQPVMLVETDKATTEIPAPVNGTVEEIRVKPGEVVKVGDVLMVFLEEGGEARQPEAARELRAPEPAPGLSPAVPVPAPAGPGAREAQRESEAAPEGKEGPVPAAPSTRRLARELGVDLHMVTPSGPGGRVTSEDVLAHAETKKAKPAVKEIPPTEREAVPALSAAPFPMAPLPDFGQWGPVERVPLRSV
ncbi:MAG: biotin/lipoyl-binding protein, partial [Syntrophobacteraceae bacterium]|nr:biotin/lipoyl-binding protein [Syntrophobacteraceae bacterium]